MTNPDMWIALVILTALGIALGIDNITLMSILTGKLPKDQQAARPRGGWDVAMLSR